MSNYIILDSNFSTTRRLMKNSSEIVSKELKETKKSEEQFETIMFLPKHKDLISEYRGLSEPELFVQFA